ncbi:molybdopterin-dependent oxidoreductase [Conexibacter sp. W3-3-2]|uniref:molybdopterin-dependent oxidoreductase n=1 Tax=Conexibacter sp. W3-3-2 TaxID=2675227 RepID=UPI0012B9C83D|nr:molybdopterin-dependent oxidoreductase [Conexibacter sp. W3-3-2]MTD47553.1 molybdopterin-dependent oxidoreductase [Conexibacter sp. W3-3-2]
MTSSSDDPASQETTPIGRRAFLGTLAVGGVTLATGNALTDALARLASPITGRLPQGVRDAVPASSSGWRIYTVSRPMPQFEPSRWRLDIDGDVTQPIRYSYDELLTLPRTTQTSDFHCVTGWSVQNVRWEGVSVAAILDRAGLLAGARAVRFVSAERPYVDSLTLAQARLDDVLLAYRMDGRALSRAHGAPLRLVVPKMYGYKSVKWVERLEVTGDRSPGYWEQRGYDADAWIDPDDAV